jgi:hypothetical protein
MLLRAKLKPPDADWKARLDERGFTPDHPFEIPQLEPLKTRLLAIAGTAVVLPGHEPDLDYILNRGEVWRGYNAISRKGQPCHCHANSAELWERDKSLTLCTGYAMTNDTVWRQHSWVLTPNNVVIETTTPRLLYFGFRMTKREAQIFSEQNFF